MHHKNDHVNFINNYLNLIFGGFSAIRPNCMLARGSSGGGGDRGIRRLSFDGGLAASASYVDVRRVWRKEKGSDKGELWSSCGFQLHCDPEFEKSNVKITKLQTYYLFFSYHIVFFQVQFTPFSSVFIKIPKYILNFIVVTYFLTHYWNSRFLLKHKILFLLFSEFQYNPGWKYQLLL